MINFGFVKKIINNQSGVALVTSLMLTLISLTIVMSLLYMVTSGIQASAANKRYKTVLQAAYGATDLVTKDVIKKVFEGYSTSAKLQSQYPTVAGFTVDPCINQKINKNSDAWTSACQPSSLSARQSPDLTFLLQATSNQPFRVYAKVVDTFIGNTDTAYNSNLSSALNVTESRSETGELKPSSYRIEIQAERSNNPQERANISVLYAY